MPGNQLLAATLEASATTRTFVIENLILQLCIGQDEFLKCVCVRERSEEGRVRVGEEIGSTRQAPAEMRWAVSDVNVKCQWCRCFVSRAQ